MRNISKILLWKSCLGCKAKYLVAIASAIGGVFMSTQAFATVVSGSGGDVDWTSDVIQTNGSAHAVDTADGRVMRLVDSVPSQAGSAFFENRYVLGRNSDFATMFTFRITPADPGGLRSDGLTFAISRQPTSLGIAGGDLGYGGVSPSVAVEFDIHQNADWDDNDSHVAVLSNGNVRAHLSQHPTAPRMDNGDMWRAIIRYAGKEDILSIQLADLDKPEISAFTFTHKIDIANIMGCGSAGCFYSYFGFTAGTGAGSANHDIINWTMATPEPGILPMMGLGLSLLGFLSFRGKRRPSR